MSLMNTQTKSEELPGNNYTSLAVRQRVLQRSIIKGYFHNRQLMTHEPLLRDDYNSVGGLEFGYRSQNGNWQGSGGYGMAFTEDQDDQNHFYSATAGYDGKSFNFYANTEIYDERATWTEDTSALDATLIQSILNAQPPVTVDNVQTDIVNDGGNTIGDISLFLYLATILYGMSLTSITTKAE